MGGRADVRVQPSGNRFAQPTVFFPVLQRDHGPLLCEYKEEDGEEVRATGEG